METRLDRYEGAREGKIEQLKELIASSENIVFLGGAGVSTESGIPDFRSGEGIFNQDSGLKYRPIDVVSHTFFIEHPEESAQIKTLYNDFYKNYNFEHCMDRMEQMIKDAYRYHTEGHKKPIDLGE